MKNSQFLALTLVLLCSSSYAQTSWQCTNKHAEISCTQQNCQVQTEDFTSFNFLIDSNKEISICAYSGCWRGPVTYTNSKKFDQYFTQQLIWNNGETKDESFSITIDKTTKLGNLLGSGFILPLICESK
ncbi:MULTISPECIES: hypothetical protein [Acinetobacter]|uniref:hypothetical protein n=1 Tax=Acinetobacter TaxID=469 RepID=UPI001269C6A7|nr:hypothetical protein [Acinetobacter sp. HR7]